MRQPGAANDTEWERDGGVRNRQEGNGGNLVLKHRWITKGIETQNEKDCKDSVFILCGPFFFVFNKTQSLL